MFLWYFIPSSTVADANARHFARNRPGLRALFRLLDLGARLMRTLVKAGLTWHVRRTTVAALEALDDDALDDIGLYRSDIPRVARDSAERHVANRLGLARRY